MDLLKFIIRHIFMYMGSLLLTLVSMLYIVGESKILEFRITPFVIAAILTVIVHVFTTD